MKVAVVTQYFPTSEQPWAGHSCYQTLRQLARRCEVKVFYPEAVYPRWLRPSSHLHDRLDRNYQPNDVPVQYVPFPVLPMISRPLNGWSISRALLPHLRRYEPDILFNYVIYPDGFAAVRLGRELRVPVVLTAIGSDLNRIAPFCERWTRQALQRASSTTTVSADLLRTAQRLGARADGSRAILNGCDTENFAPQDRAAARKVLDIPAEAEAVVYVGRLDRRKGLVELIEAIAALKESRPALHCYVVGEGPDKPLLLEVAARHGDRGWISFCPSCTTQQIAVWMAAANVVALPSYKEGCPNVVIEALTAGRPVVASNVGGIPELMDSSSGRLVPPMDIPALTRALAEVLTQSWDAEALSRRHRRSWADVADDVEDVLQETLARSGTATRL